MAERMRLDKALSGRGLARSRSHAQDLIARGVVLADGQPVTKPSATVGRDTDLRLAEGADMWVSRAALKLVHGLDYFDVDVRDAVAADVGASTGGFTQVLLARGAGRVFAIDVGHGQLDAALAGDPRVVSMEKTNARAIVSGDLPALDLIVSDVSFISLTKALPGVLGCARAGAALVALVKPQFEVGPDGVGKGGIVRDGAARAASCDAVAAFLQTVGWTVAGLTESPITGSDGNIEFLIHAWKDPAP